MGGTSEVLYRMWCAGEITTGVRNKIRTQVIACDDYTPPGEKELQNLEYVWSVEQQHTLMTFGIELDMIRAAYREVVKIPTIQFKRFGSSSEQVDAVYQVVQQGKLGGLVGAGK